MNGGGSGPVRALVVDDEEALRRLVTGYLEREGFEVTAAADGERAIALARSTQPDVIVLDLITRGKALLPRRRLGSSG